MKPGIVILGLSGLLASCQLALKYEPVSIKELLPAGSTLTLNREIEIPADRSSVYIFRGKVTPYSQVDVYYPYCQLKLYKISGRSRQVYPDTFEVTKVVEWEDYSRNETYKVADLTGGVGIKGGIGIYDNNGGPSIINYATIISLHSVRQAQVKEMVCGHWGDQGEIEPLTLEELKSTLVELFVVSPKSS